MHCGFTFGDVTYSTAGIGNECQRGKPLRNS